MILLDILRRPQFLAEYAFGRALLAAGEALPLETALRMGECAGRAMMPFTRKNVQAAVNNLLAAYPGMTRDEAERMTRRVYAHFGRATIEIARCHRLLSRSAFRDHVVVINEHHLEAVRAAGKGAIFVTAHFGVWEAFSLLLHHAGFQIHSVYRPAKNPLLDRLILKRRAWFGQTMISREGAMTHLLRTLRGGGYIALLADQHAKKYGVWVPFFGRPASTTPAPALLALRTGAPIVTGYARRLPGLYRFEIFWDEPIRAEPSADRQADVRRITAEITRRTEAHIRRSPEQWLWMHRRWRRTPSQVPAGGSSDVGSPGQAD